MVNQQKIITMTQLALYDKNEGDADQAANNYFRHDYIYRKNFGTRLAVGLGGCILLVLYWSYVIFVHEIDVFSLYMDAVISQSILFIVALLAVYSFIGTMQGTREYYLLQKRLNNYQTWVRQLERIEEKSKGTRHDADTGGKGTDS
jgi:hypothetical protein